MNYELFWVVAFIPSIGHWSLPTAQKTDDWWLLTDDWKRASPTISNIWIFTWYLETKILKTEAISLNLIYKIQQLRW